MTIAIHRHMKLT